MEKKKKETDLKGLKSTRFFFNCSNSRASQKYMSCNSKMSNSSSGKKSAKMKKWNKFSLFVRAPSTCLKHRSYSQA